MEARNPHRWWILVVLCLSTLVLVVDSMALTPRPTPLPSGMEAWLETFAEPMLGLLPPEERAAAKAEAVALLRPALCHDGERWVADYVRLRFAATLA